MALPSGSVTRTPTAGTWYLLRNRATIVADTECTFYLDEIRDRPLQAEIQRHLKALEKAAATGAAAVTALDALDRLNNWEF